MFETCQGHEAQKRLRNSKTPQIDNKMEQVTGSFPIKQLEKLEWGLRIIQQ